MAKKDSNNKAKGKSVGKLMYIYCEGDKTEPNYIESYISDKNGSRMSIFRIPKTRKNTPEQLVDEAIKKKGEPGADGDVFWVVYDREAVNSTTMQAHSRAWNKAKKNGINVAISCVCFEFWILLHCGYTTKTFTSYSDLASNSPLKKIFPNYDKGDRGIYNLLRSSKDGKISIDNAIANADKLRKHNIRQYGDLDDYHYEAFTAFDQLLKAIDDFANA